ncbi:MAG: DUF4349 domain-containing protein [Byssovorax sp.]
MHDLLRSPRRTGTGMRRLLVTLMMQLSMLGLSTGCGAAPPMSADAPVMREAPGGMAMPAPPPPPADAPAAAAPPPAQPAPAPVAPGAAPAMYEEQAAPASAPARAPAAAGKASVAKGAPPPAKGAPPAPAKTPPPPAKAPPPAKTADKAPANDKAADKAPGPTTPAAPLLIYVGDLQMQVLEEAAIPASIDKVIDVAETLGGYLAGRKDTSVQVRIPSAYFREGFTRIEQIAEVLHRSVTADDVSEQYSDLEVRLANLRATHKRLQEFLAKSGSIQDMLTVGRELERVAGEIEAIEGKMRFLRSRAAFSLVTVAFQVKPKPVVVVAQKDPPPPPPPPIRPISLPIPWLPKVGLDNLLNLH